MYTFQLELHEDPAALYGSDCLSCMHSLIWMVLSMSTLASVSLSKTSGRFTPVHFAVWRNVMMEVQILQSGFI